MGYAKIGLKAGLEIHQQYNPFLFPKERVSTTSPKKRVGFAALKPTKVCNGLL